MRIRLTPHEARVIGSLIEKEITTPAQYPLSLNSLTAACNQKSSREPVMQLSEKAVQEVVDDLVKRHLVSNRGGFGSRVTKYQHRFANVGFGSLEFSAQEMGILCLLLLRGPQTAGELRSHSGRLCQFTDVNETENVLRGLAERSDGPFVVQLAREPGRREARYAHLFGDQDVETTVPVATQAPIASGDAEGQSRSSDRITQLEDLVLNLQEELEAIKARLEALESGSRD
ncbi:MAG: DUF480 domain-containing protein [Gammaproteobacteria bacterium]|nr:DUF480 domain-containing protein [Gammaproteobacteria bacterium]